MSTTRYEHDILETLRSSISSPSLFVEIPHLGADISHKMICEWLQDDGRALTAPQMDVVRNALTKCSLPLYTRLVFDEVCTWRSFRNIEDTQLKFTVKGARTCCADDVQINMSEAGVCTLTVCLSYSALRRSHRRPVRPHGEVPRQSVHVARSLLPDGVQDWPQ